jgi:hypothetical protein
MDEFSALIPANVPVTPVKKTGIFILRSSHPSIIRLVGVLGSVIVGVILWLIGCTWRRSGKRSRQGDISQCNRRVRFIPPRADMCGAVADVRYGPKAHIAN